MLETQTTFEAFFELWLIRLEHHLQDLLRAAERGDDKENEKDLINQTVAHYSEYFSAKEKVAQENVFLVISPTWFTSFERAHLWIGGFMPCLAFRLVSNNVTDLTDDQSQKIGRLMKEIKAEETQALDEFNRVQDWMVIKSVTFYPLKYHWVGGDPTSEQFNIGGVVFSGIRIPGRGRKPFASDTMKEFQSHLKVSPPIIEPLRQLGRVQNGMDDQMDSIIDGLKMAMEDVVDCADYVRKKVVGILVMEILRPAQAVKFLAAPVTLQLRFRRNNSAHTPAF